MLLAQNYMELLVEDDVQQLRKWAEEELKKEIPEDAQKLTAAISGSKDVNNLNSFISSYSGGSSSVSILLLPSYTCIWSLTDTSTAVTLTLTLSHRTNVFFSCRALLRLKAALRWPVLLVLISLWTFKAHRLSWTSTLKKLHVNSAWTSSNCSSRLTFPSWLHAAVIALRSLLKPRWSTLPPLLLKSMRLSRPKKT